MKIKKIDGIFVMMKQRKYFNRVIRLKDNQIIITLNMNYYNLTTKTNIEM